MPIQVVDQPLVQDSLSYLREKTTPIEKFREHSNKVSQVLLTEAVKHFAVQPVSIETPLATVSAQRLQADVVVIPVLRAGLAMLFGALQLLPSVGVGFVGLERDEKTAIAREYYWKLPKISANSTVLITDPMLATGGSSLHVLEKIAPLKPQKIILVSVLAAPEGVAAIQEKFPDVQIVVGAIDDHLNAQKYIVPGLGDYGDRYFGT